MKPKVEIVDRAINQELLDELIYSYSNNPNYDRNNKETWDQSIIGYSSDVLVNDLNDDERERLLSYVFKFYPKLSHYEKVSAMFYRWTPNSYIPPHNDVNATVSITIHLNQMYDPKEGGYFLYKPEGKDKRYVPDWICVEPIYNRLVCVEGNVEHTVTPVTSLRNRLSLQMFWV